MCHDDASRPPAPAGAGPVPTVVPDLRLTASDGATLMAHAALTGQRTGAGIVVMPDVRGLHGFYRVLAEQFASVGVDAVAIDYFARTAETDDRSDDFAFRPHVEQTTPEGVAADVAAAAAWLRSPEGGAVSHVFTVGFCFGGGQSWRQSAEQPDLAGCIGFYGRPGLAAEATERMSAPLLMLVAGADQHIAVDEAEALAASAREAGVDADVHVYDGAPHSFFDRTFAEHAEACTDAWERMRAFIDAHSR